MVSKEKLITISKEIRDYIIPLSDEEFYQLEQNIIKEGCRDPLIIWSKKGQQILVDGHNRYRICQKHNIPFRVKGLDFKDLDEIKIWMVENQIGRRNLTADQISYYRGLKYIAHKKKKGGYENVKSKGNENQSTSEALAEEFNISESTVKRDAKFAEGLSIIGRTNPKLKMKILTGEAKVKKADLQILSSAKNADKIIIKNEADLFNKAKLIREDIINEIESKVQKIQSGKLSKAQEILAIKDPIFVNREDRLKRIKGMIISAVNRAINSKDETAIKELKKLIDKLTDEIFE